MSTLCMALLSIVLTRSRTSRKAGRSKRMHKKGSMCNIAQWPQRTASELLELGPLASFIGTVVSCRGDYPTAI